MPSQPPVLPASPASLERAAPLHHLLIADAAPLPGAHAPASAAADAATALPPLPNLDALLTRLRPAGSIACEEDAPETPHALAVARANGLPGQPGRHPWAAFESGTVGIPCAWLRPAHLQMGMDDVQLIVLNQLELSEDESQQLLNACASLLAEDGLTLRAAFPGAWLVQGELLRGVYAPAPERAAGRLLTRSELARADDPAQQRLLARLLSELEMVLATHPISQAREAARRWPINSVWVHGAGVLEAPLPPAPGVRVAAQLSQGDALHDSAAHAAAWQAIDRQEAAELLDTLRSGQAVQLTLSGPRRAVTLAGPTGGFMGRITSLFGRPRLLDVRKQL
jgi:hypothetical protein